MNKSKQRNLKKRSKELDIKKRRKKQKKNKRRRSKNQLRIYKLRKGLFKMMECLIPLDPR